MKINQKNRFILTRGFILSIAFILLAIFTIYEENQRIEEKYEERVVTFAQLNSMDLTMKQELTKDTPNLDSYYNAQYRLYSELEMINVMDLDGTLYTSWSDLEVNDTFKFSLDEEDLAKLKDGTAWSGYYRDTNNHRHYMIAFNPIYSDTEQTGIMAVAVLKDTITMEKVSQSTNIALGFTVALVISLLSLSWISRKFKRDLLGFNPSEIALLYAENKSIIEQLDEAIISIDDDYNITTLNITAQKMFNLTPDVLGEKVHEIFPYCDFKEIVEKNKHIVNKYRKIDEEKYLMNAHPLYLEGEIIGATAIFRSHYEVDALVDQISGYQQIAEALRNQKHEFQNKLHVVLGLIKMNDYEKAENYIMENVYTTNLASDYYTSRIKDDRVLALFVGKEIQSKEYNATLLLTSDSYMSKTHNPINSDDIVLVLGNLIDNSFEAYTKSDAETKRVVVDIFEDEERVKMTVIDQAGGVSPDVIDKMFERGVSTKNGESRGTGLSLVNEIVHVYNGEKTVISSEDETKIEIILLKVIS